ncbi:hypothetical protein JKF63_02430 [Porcisia hertigi]|uniref:Uncharacterized protein n=1 Tax=Porcisia hertigi TaxID=2761500 RepID=A0A836L2S4_9TRYP|nr:hypothetical protein JKF63_02430 [Porcisia hertigi]
MGCKASSMKGGARGVSRKGELASNGPKASAGDTEGNAESSGNAKHSSDSSPSNRAAKRAEKTTRPREGEKNIKKDFCSVAEPCVFDTSLDFKPVIYPADMHLQPATMYPDVRSTGSSANEELNGSFSIDLSGSFRMSYSNKGDILPVPEIPQARVSRSVSPRLLSTVSPHPSDDDLVLICTDCGVEINESCVLVVCPLTGKLHV